MVGETREALEPPPPPPPPQRKNRVEFYTKFLNYNLENVRQRPMDWLTGWPS